MLGILAEAGIHPVDQPREADLLLVNTCGFIRSAVEEGVETILELIEQKRSPEVKVIVCGCMVQRYGDELARELPEVDLFLGTEELTDIVQRLQALERDENALRLSPAAKLFSLNAVVAKAEREGLFLSHAALPRRLATPPHRAYLKITEGCANRCSYCMIPAIRGPLRSRPLDDVLREAEGLAEAGVKELTLVGQDLTAYGLDRGPGSPRLPDLLARLQVEVDIPWIRMLYLYPSRVNRELLELVASSSRLLPYFDLPFQHVADPVLKAMNRPYGEKLVRNLVSDIRRITPQAVIRSTFMVGFPGEGEEELERLATFMAEARLEHVGIFTYCDEEGCAASSLPDHCAEELKEQRRDRLMRLQAEISLDHNRRRVGGVEEVLVEGVSGESDLLLEGRSWFQAPDIDGCVYINEGECEAGELVRVKIREAHPYDLVGSVLSD